MRPCTLIDEVPRHARSRRAFRCQVVVAAILISTILPVPRTSYAFDDQRKGFLIGLGAGAGYCFGGQPDLPWRSNVEENQFGSTFEGKIGYGWSRLGVFVDYRSAHYSSFSTRIAGLGVAYYLSDLAPGLYFTGTIGPSRWDESDSEGGSWFGVAEHSANASGVGVCVAGGWEIWRNWSIETSVMWGHATGDYQNYYENERGEIDMTFTALLLTINYVKY